MPQRVEAGYEQSRYRSQFGRIAKRMASHPSNAKRASRADQCLQDRAEKEEREIVSCNSYFQAWLQFNLTSYHLSVKLH
jgi:hypothetical protein